MAASGRTDEAAALYGDWLERTPGHPLWHAIQFNRGVLLGGMNDLAGAAHAYGEAIRVNPGFLPPYVNLGTIYERVGASDHALAQWSHVMNALAALTGDATGLKVTAMKQAGRVLETLARLNQAEDVLRQIIELRPTLRDVVQHWISLRQRQGKWPVLEPVGDLNRRDLLARMAPLSLAAYTDDPMLHLANAYLYSREDVGRPERFRTTADFEARRRDDRRRLRIGYLSSDLREHAIGFLAADMFRLHDRSRVEVFGYYCGIKADDPVKLRIKDTFEHWKDVRDLDDEALDRLIFEDGIDILVDVNGNTKDARTKMLSRRPAPIIVNWLGYPGTMGSPYHHYIVADDFIIPEGSEIYYSEAVRRLPCYQPNDRHRVVAPSKSRADVGLPEGAMVYCSFNGTQKITPATFGRWMEILRQVPDSVLWLLKGSEEVDVRLRSLAEQAGVAPDRLVFAPFCPNRDHVARYPLADLFLDSLPYGAHTTSSDALWMGVPVLTLPGRSFASRVCGSLVRAAGLPELICGSAEEYVRMAVELGRDRARLAGYRQRLLENRETSVLFDTALLVRSMEDLYAGMWADFVAGKLPVPDLRNLDLYNEIGCGLDHDTVELTFVPDYHGLYRSQLAARHRFSPIPPDSRLWTNPS